MKKISKLLKKNKERVYLTRKEQAAGRRSLLAHMKNHPASVGAALPGMSWVDWLFRGQRILAGAVVAILIVAITSTGVAMGSENTLPGDFLYSVKVEVADE